MSATLNFPLWQCSNNNNNNNSPSSRADTPDSSDDLDLIIGRLASGGDKTTSSSSLGDESESDSRHNHGKRPFDASSLNNNVTSDDCDVEKCSAGRRECGFPDGRLPKRRKSTDDEDDDDDDERQQIMRDAGTVGGDDDDDDDEDEEDDDVGGGGEEVETEGGTATEMERRERSPRQQHQLPTPDAINTTDVTRSRDITSNPPRSIAGGTCARREDELRRKGSCSAGSYSRRKHHKHHKHKRRRSESPAAVETGDSTPVSPKVNPIFLWVRQDDTRIVEVMCEDYDHRNRIRLTRTHLGWRAIPKTERFAAAIIPKPPPTGENSGSGKRSHRKKPSKKKKSKETKVPVQCDDDRIQVKECSAMLTQDEGHTQRHQRSSSVESLIKRLEDRPVKLTKSASCDLRKQLDESRIPRSGSLDLSMDDETRTELERLFKVQMDERRTSRIDSEAEATKEDAKTKDPTEETDNVLVDIAKHEAELNDADCDALGELLKDIPDLEFVEEEMDEEEWSTPTDLTLPKTKTTDEDCPRVKLPLLPPNISPLVTVTSATKPPEPLTAPLPEVTITPIPTPKPAHQHKRQNNFLETLLSTSCPVKPERTERKRSSMESSSKRMKVEDITLKSLLSARQNSDRQAKGLELESHVQKMRSKQESELADMSKSRLHELLTDGGSSGSADPIAQLKQVLSNPDLAVPDPLLVPRARLPALVASPASEIPRLLTMHLDKKIEETPCPPMTDSDMLEVSLSNLRSLLSCNPDKMKSTDADDLASYQKSLEAFLEWQRYQTELLEAQMKAAGAAPLTPGLSPADIDLATATALNQMLWLPYLDLNCTGAAGLSSVFPHNYPISPHFPQSSPFLTPTSPMDIDTQMKTLAMWQEAVLAHQTSQKTRKPGPANTLKVPATATGVQRKRRPSPIPSPQKVRGYPRSDKTHFNFDSHLQLQQLQQEALIRQQYEMQRKQQRRQRHQEPNMARQGFDVEGEKKSRGAISVKPMSNLMDKRVGGSSGKSRQSWQQFEQELRKSAEMTNQMAIRWQQFEEEMRKSGRCQSGGSKMMRGVKSEEWPTTTMTTTSGERQPAETSGGERKPVVAERAKLKVKNLVDPNMSPPKLLKQIGPVDLAGVGDETGSVVPDESQSHLWHPLFGSSNQMKQQQQQQQYNSPWRWTTVTVNGE